ncbi:MAG: class I SAM-dependent methyltransferase [Candidatus Kariarchaeaceae archaeon]|jgi:SAM-dependent methyltransferase
MKKSPDEYIETNKKRWNELADIHITSEFYDVESFKAGKNSIGKIEQNEIGDVTGKHLLHLQCHFGKDTLSWARMGATVTGVDFSDRAIHHAKILSEEIGLSANFIQSDIYKLRSTEIEPTSFDIVFTSHGTIYWLPDLKEWAKLIAYYLKPGGFFYIMDSHPTGHIFDDMAKENLIVKYSYFHDKKPMMFEEDGSYSDPNLKLQNKKEYGWQHSLSDIINALIGAGLHIEFLHEFPSLSWAMVPFMEERDDGLFYLPDNFPDIPLMFSLKATKK